LSHALETKRVAKKIGSRLRQYRMEQGLTIEALAERIGISKLTLGQVERGEANPTLAVIWRIASGLGIPLTALLSVENEVAIARCGSDLKLSSANEDFTVEPLFSSYGNRPFELYRATLKPGSCYASEAHPPGVTEYVTVMSGHLVLEIDGETYKVRQYETIRFDADRPHKYFNPGTDHAVLHFVIAYNHPSPEGSVFFDRIRDARTFPADGDS
jgi:transcriptional regulator with XRE-family HTH domain